MKHTNQDLGQTSPNNLIIVKDPWSGRQSDNPWKY